MNGARMLGSSSCSNTSLLCGSCVKGWYTQILLFRVLAVAWRNSSEQYTAGSAITNTSPKCKSNLLSVGSFRLQNPANSRNRLYATHEEDPYVKPKLSVIYCARCLNTSPHKNKRIWKWNNWEPNMFVLRARKKQFPSGAPLTGIMLWATSAGKKFEAAISLPQSFSSSAQNPPPLALI